MGKRIVSASKFFYGAIAFAFLGSLLSCSSTSPADLIPPSVGISVSAPATTILTGQTIQLTATVSNTSNTGVIWEVSGVQGGNSTVGTISSSGLYTAPATPPTPAQVTITAAAAADTSISGSVSLTIVPPVAVTILPATATVQTQNTVTFTAVVSNTSNTSVQWQVNGVLGGGPVYGTISQSGIYTAPASVPTPATATVTAVSVADPTKSASASVTITPVPPIVVNVTPNISALQTGTSEQFTAVVSNTSNSAVTWDVQGIAGGDATFGTINSSGLYTAPASVPSPSTVVVSAVSQANPAISGNATVTISLTPPPVSVTVSPKTVNVAVGITQTFTATVTNSSNTSVTWEVNSLPGGNSQVGTISTSGVYTAPSVVPFPATVTVEAFSNVDTSKFDTASVTIQPNISVSVQPSAVNLLVSQGQAFTASVSNTSNQSVTWTLNGPSCSGTQCGTIDLNGNYIAPAAVPSPTPTVNVVATSTVDPTQSGSAVVTVTAVPTPNVTISGPNSLGFGGNSTYTATVTMDPSNQGVTWTLVCLADGEIPLDCANESDGDTDAFTLSNQTPFSVTLNAPSQPDVDSNPPNNGNTVALIATSIAMGTNGGQGCTSIQVSTPNPPTQTAIPPC